MHSTAVCKQAGAVQAWGALYKEGCTADPQKALYQLAKAKGQSRTTILFREAQPVLLLL